MLRDKLAAIAAAGFDGVEIFENDLLQFSGAPSEVRAMAAEARSMMVLDHHKTAQAELAGIDAECYRDTLDRLPTVVFDMDKSGGRAATVGFVIVNQLAFYVMVHRATSGPASADGGGPSPRSSSSHA